MEKFEPAIKSKQLLLKKYPDAHVRHWREADADGQKKRFYQLFADGKAISDVVKYEYRAWNDAYKKIFPETAVPKDTRLSVSLATEQVELCGGRQLLRKKVLGFIRRLVAEAKKDPAMAQVGPETAVNRILSEDGYHVLKV